MHGLTERQLMICELEDSILQFIGGALALEELVMTTRAPNVRDNYKLDFEGQNLQQKLKKEGKYIFIHVIADYYIVIYTAILADKIAIVLGNITKITEFSYVCPLAADQ